MSNWRTFPEKAWSPIGKILSGFGKGEGSYGAAYAIDTSVGPILNGRVSAHVRLAGDRPVHGAGLVSRANELRSFAALYVLTDENTPDAYGVRLAAFKYGKLETLVGMKQAIAIPDKEFGIAMQFFSGEIVGQIVTDLETHTLKYILPELPFPGYCGAVRFYGSAVTIQNIHIEEIKMKPILPEVDDSSAQSQHPYCVFLSHSSADNDKISKLVEVLKTSGITYWVDRERITFGDGIVAKIEEGLQKSKFVVVCLSEALAKSGWCRAEYGPILYREFSGDTSRRVIPLSLDGSKDNDSVPLLLSDKMRADFTDKDSLSAFIEFLRNSGTK